MNSQVIVAQTSPRTDSYLMEIPVGSVGQSRIPMPLYIAELQSNDTTVFVLKAIRLITPAVLTHAVQNDGVNAPLAELKKMVLVLTINGQTRGFNIPIITLNDVDDGATPFTHDLANFDDWQNIDWGKSYIQFANGQVSANTPYNVLLDIQFIRLAKGNGQRV